MASAKSAGPPSPPSPPQNSRVSTSEKDKDASSGQSSGKREKRKAPEGASHKAHRSSPHKASRKLKTTSFQTDSRVVESATGSISGSVDSKDTSKSAHGKKSDLRYQKRAQDDKPRHLEDDKPKPSKDDKPKPSKDDKPKTSEDDKLEPSEDDKPKPSEDDKGKPSKDDKPKSTHNDKPKPSKEDEPKPSKEDEPKPSKEDEPKPSKDDKPKPKHDDKPKPSEEDEPKPSPDLESAISQENQPQDRFKKSTYRDRSTRSTFGHFRSKVSSKRKTQGAYSLVSKKRLKDSAAEGDDEAERGSSKHSSAGKPFSKDSHSLKRKDDSMYFRSKRGRATSGDSETLLSWHRPVGKPDRKNGSFFNEQGYYVAKREKIIEYTDLKTQLAELETIGIATVFEDICYMYSILNPKVKSMFDDDELLVYRTIAERFHGKPLDLPIIAGRERDKANLETHLYERIKLVEILNAALNELLWFGSYSTLQNAVLICHIKEIDERTMEEEGRIIKKQKNLVKKEIQKWKDAYKRKLYSCNTKVLKKQGFFRKLEIHQGREMDYLTRWNAARESQNIYKLRRKEKECKEKCEKTQREIELAVYTHNNIMLFMRKDIESLKAQIRNYDAKFSEDTEAIEESLISNRADLENLQKKKTYLASLNAQMGNRIRTLIQRKEEAIAEEREHRRRDKAARVIQKWWRLHLWKKKVRRKWKKGRKGKKGKKSKQGRKSRKASRGRQKKGASRASSAGRSRASKKSKEGRESKRSRREGRESRAKGGSRASKKSREGRKKRESRKRKT